MFESENDILSNILSSETITPDFYKCGEVFMNQSGRVIFKCINCDRKVEENFIEHFTKYHFQSIFNQSKIPKCPSPRQKVVKNEETLENVKLEKLELKDSLGEKLTDTADEDYNIHEIPKIENTYETDEKLKKKIKKINIKEPISHICQYCGKKSTKKSNLQSHINARHKNEGRKTFKCNSCERSFKKFESLQSHIKNSHTFNEKHFLCNIDNCEKRFLDEKSLKHHEAYHKKERKYICSVCNKAYIHKCKLDIHFNMYHVMGKTHHCTQCNKSFYDHYNLKKHMVCHSDEKPFQCDECPARFPRKSALTLHKKVHSGIKSYVCHICGKSYHIFSGIYAHMKTHGIKYKKGLTALPDTNHFVDQCETNHFVNQ